MTKEQRLHEIKRKRNLNDLMNYSLADPTATAFEDLRAHHRPNHQILREFMQKRKQLRTKTAPKMSSDSDD